MKSIRDVATFQGISDLPIIISKLAQSFNLQRPISLQTLLNRANARAKVDSMTQLLSSGSPGTKINIAVMGDGFAAGDDQTAYNNKVKDLLLHGVFNNDFFLERRSAFNIYRVNLISKDSGVGTKTYSNDGKTLINTITKNTALGIYYNSSWYHCWLEDGSTTSNLIDNALNKWVPDHRLTLVILNNKGSGGCGGGGRATIAMGTRWATIAHEFGHALGNLDDEYCDKKETFTDAEPNRVNTTKNTDLKTLKWKSYVNPGTPIPTGIGKCVGYTQGQRPANWNDNQSVGLFEGAGSYKQGIYRPVINCRMNSDDPSYCPVCYAQMKSVTKAYMKTREAQSAEISNDESSGYIRFKIHVDKGDFSVTDVKEVPGLFIVPTNISLGYDYEVLIGDESIALDFLPDIGVRRSFTNQDEIAPEGKHHITTLPSFDFFARIPKCRVTRQTLPQLMIKVYEVQKMPDQLMKSVPLIRHTDFIFTEIGHLKGIRLDKLPEKVRPNLERVLRENESSITQ